MVANIDLEYPIRFHSKVKGKGLQRVLLQIGPCRDKEEVLQANAWEGGKTLMWSTFLVTGTGVMIN